MDNGEEADNERDNCNRNNDVDHTRDDEKEYYGAISLIVSQMPVEITRPYPLEYLVICIYRLDDLTKEGIKFFFAHALYCYFDDL